MSYHLTASLVSTNVNTYAIMPTPVLIFLHYLHSATNDICIVPIIFLGDTS